MINKKAENEPKVRAFLIPFMKGGKFYIYDYVHQKLLEECYDRVRFVDDTFCYSLSILLSRNNRVAIATSIEDLRQNKWYDSISIFGSPQIFYIVKINSLYGVINDNNEIIIPIEFDQIDSVQFKKETYLIYKKKNQWGIYEMRSKTELLSMNYGMIRKNNRSGLDNHLIIVQNSFLSVYDLESKRTIAIGIVDDIGMFNEDICSIKLANSWFLYKTNHEVVLNNNKFSKIGTMINGFALCKRDRKTYIVESNGDEIEIGELDESYERDGDVVYTTTSDEEYFYIKLFLREKYIRTIQIEDNKSGWPIIDIFGNYYIKVTYYSEKFGVYSSGGIFTLHGPDEPDEIFKTQIPLLKTLDEVNMIPLEKTEWFLDSDRICFKKDVVFSTEYEGLNVDDFRSGLAMVKELVNIYPISYVDVGFIDINGKKYWE